MPRNRSAAPARAPRGPAPRPDVVVAAELGEERAERGPERRHAGYRSPLALELLQRLPAVEDGEEKLLVRGKGPFLDAESLEIGLGEIHRRIDGRVARLEDTVEHVRLDGGGRTSIVAARVHPELLGDGPVALALDHIESGLDAHDL